MEAIIGKEFSKKVIPLIDACKSSLKIVVFDWRWYPNDPGNPVQLFNQSIIRAKRRGVEIKVITNIADVISVLKSQGIDARKLQTDRLVHSKMMILDDEKMVIGSHNYTQSAFTMNYEISVLTEAKNELDKFSKYFDNLFNNYG